MKGFLCEPTLDGVFTGIYDIWADWEKADHKKLFLEGELNRTVKRQKRWQDR